MKKVSSILIFLLTVCILATSLIGCSFFNAGGGGSDTDKTDVKVEEKTEAEKQAEQEAAEKAAKKAQYNAIIAEMQQAIADADSLNDYVAAMLTVLTKLPQEDLTTAVGLVAGEDAKELVKEYYDECVQVVTYVKDFLPSVNSLLSVIDEAQKSALGSLVLKTAGVKQNDDGSYTGFGYTIGIVEDDGVNDEAYRVVDKNDNTYYLGYQNATKSVNCTVTKEDESLKFDVGSKIVGKNLYVQFFNAQKGKNFQVKIDTSLLEATVSINETEEAPSSIRAGIPTAFATEGTVFKINKDMLAALETAAKAE